MAPRREAVSYTHLDVYKRQPYGSFPELEVYKDGGYGGYAYRTAPAKRAAEADKAAD